MAAPWAQTGIKSQNETSPSKFKYHNIGNSIIIGNERKLDSRCSNSRSSGFIGNSKDIIIPSYIDDQPVEYLGECCFSYSSITSVYVPYTVRQILFDCFFRCQKITKVTFAPGSNLEYLDDASFYESSLSEIVLPSSLKYVSFNCFCRTTKLNSIAY